MGLRDAIRALLDGDGDETDDTGEISEIEQGVSELDDGSDSELDGDGSDGEVDSDGSDGEVDGELDGTPGDEVESPEVAELRQQILDLAAENETLRNRLAAAGLEDEVDDTAGTMIDDTADEDTVEAFDKDYAERQAALAEITKDN